MSDYPTNQALEKKSQRRAMIAGQVDVDAYVIDFAGSRGRVSLHAETEINLRITASKFEGTLSAWAQRPVRMPGDS